MRYSPLFNTVRVVAAGCLLAIAFACGCEDTEREQQAIRECAADLADGIANRNGEKVANRMTNSSIQLYERLLPIARKGTRAQLLSLPVGERAEAIGMRYGNSRIKLSKANGRAWVVEAVNAGEFEVGECSPETLGKVTVEGDFAKARVLYEGEPAVDLRDEPAYFEFVLEDGVWKLDETHHYQFFGAWYEEMASFSNRDINEFLVDEMADAYDVPSNPAVLDGPVH